MFAGLLALASALVPTASFGRAAGLDATGHRSSGIVARELTFAAALEVTTAPFAASAERSVGEWLGNEDALKILMSQAESARRLDAGGDVQQRWEVNTPIDFPGMVARSSTAMDITIDKQTPSLSIRSGESTTTCEGGPPWAKGLLSRVNDIAKTTSSNDIEVREVAGGQTVCVSKVDLAVSLNIPTLLLPPFIPAGSFEKAGSDSLQKLLDKDMASVLDRFREGYLKFAKGE